MRTIAAAQPNRHSDACLAREVLAHVPDAWVDYSKIRAAYAIPINRYFSVYKPPRPLAEVETEITNLGGVFSGLLNGLLG